MSAVDNAAAPPRAARVAVACGALIAVALAYPVWLAASAASRTMFGRDQGIYHFAAWAISRGVRDYVDICDINGPLTHGVHQFLIWLAGPTERGFRVLDLAITSASFAVTGACLPGLTRGPRDATPTLPVRVAFAAAACVALNVQYLSYTYWDIGQRENFCNWLLLPSIGLQLLAQGNAALSRAPRGQQRALLVLAGALSLLPWFIKPSYVLCTALQLVMLWAAPVSSGRRFGILWFGVGAIVGLALELCWIVTFSSLPAVLRAYFYEAPLMYGPIWHTGPWQLLKRTGFPNWSLHALLAAIAVGLAARLGLLQRRALLLGGLPLVAVLHVLAQGKGFPYHYHLLTAATVLAGLAVICSLAERATARLPAGWREPHTLAAIGASMTGGLLLAWQLQSSPYLYGRSRVLEGNSYDQPRPELGRHYYYMRFNPWHLGLGAKHIRATTPPGSRIFLYGTSPYLLYLSQRDAATCDLYAHQLNVDAALDGRSASQIYEPGKPLGPAHARALSAIRDRNAQRMLADLRREPPAAAVFTDNEAFLSYRDAWRDFSSHNPEAAKFFEQHYVQSARFGTVRVWTRRP